MKNKDYNIDVEYEIKIMSTTKLREKIMKDNKLTEEIIFNYYSLNTLTSMEAFEKQKYEEDETFNQGLENAFIVVNEKSNGEYELLDGFYRILYKNLEKNVIVKVYKNITDEQWMKLMINLNYWKTHKDSVSFFDRGFLLGLRCRHNIKMEDYIMTDSISKKTMSLANILSKGVKTASINSTSFDNIKKGKDFTEQYLLAFFYKNSSNFRNKALTNEYFIRDLKVIKNYINYLPENILKLKKVKEADIFSSYAYEKFIVSIMQLIFTYRLLNSDKEMNDLPADLIDKFFENEDIKQSFIKAIGMSTCGFIDNRLESAYPKFILILNENLLKETD